MDKEIVSKIQKLLTLSESSNENEAKMAMLMAQKLLVKHKLSLQDVKGVNLEPINITEQKTKFTYTRATWKARLASIIAENFGCYTYNKKYYNKRICFFGKDEDVAVCNIVLEYAMDCIASEVKRFKNEYRRNGWLTAGIEVTYAEGFIKGLQEAFNKQKEEHQEWGLVLVKDALVVEAYEEKALGFVKSKPVTPLKGNGDAEIYRKAVEDGKKFSISDKIAEGEEEDQLMIEQGKVIDFGSEYLNRELTKFVKDNYGNGWHRVMSLVYMYKEQGLTDIEIAQAIKEIPRI